MAAVTAPASTVLTEEQRGQWQRDGYLLLKGVLSPDEIKPLVDEIDRRYETWFAEHGDPKREMYISNSFSLGDPFIKLIDHPVTFPIVVELMGPHIQAGSAFTQVRRKDLDSRGFIHTDGGHALRHIRVTETSWPLQIKVFYFLTPLPETFMGNLACVPGSHYRPFPDEPSGVLPGAPETPGVVQVIGDAGDAVVFSHALWHGGTRNETDIWRKSVVYAYMQSFMRPWDYSDIAAPEILAKCTPRQRRLLGDLGPGAQPCWHYYVDGECM